MAPSVGLKITNFLVLFMSLVLTYQQVIPVLEGRITTVSISSTEDDLERQPSRTPVKTIHTPWGDIYDCFEFHKQPAFDNFILKNHKTETREEMVSTYLDEVSGLVEGCPKGMVPIRRTTREDLVRAKSLLSLSNAPGSQFRAGITYVAKEGETIYGAMGRYNVWNPSTKQDQFTSGEMAVQFNEENQTTVIKVGWTVNPQLYGDNLTRAFIYWTADGAQKTGCYNTHCPGFIQVHSKITPDLPFGTTSKVNETQITVNFEISMEQTTGAWWLVAEGNVSIGYWPKELVPALGSGAGYVYWGGRAQASDGVGPPMGSGERSLSVDGTSVNGYVDQHKKMFEQNRKRLTNMKKVATKNIR
ncbi:uncharacterized protein LOC113352815 [Papaver somniferum]|uniref:uncharacterized protein LOC113352815 n=1 Tax=Papaver somniferum TaxID=3469 RepID=UPI000E6FAA37|nr:uncharacterized protein LOC113352815 [Papaver somniferum]